MGKTSQLFTLALLASISVNCARANDLIRMYELAVVHDATIQSSIAQRDAAIEARPQALALVLPQVTASGTIDEERISTDQPLYPVAIAGTATDHPSNYGVSASQTLFNFETFSRVRQAQRAVANAEVQLTAAQQLLITRTAEAYFNVLAAGDLVMTAQSERDAYKQLFDQASNRRETGIGPQSAVDQVRSYYDATEAQVIEAENALDDARLALKRIVGEPVTALAPLRDDFPLLPPNPDSVDEWIRSATNNSPAIRSAAYSVEAADYEIDAQIGKALPTIALVASHSRTLQAIYPGNETLDTIGLSVSIPLFQGGYILSHIRQSRAQYRQAQADYEATSRDTENTIRAAYRGVVTGIQRIDACRRTIGSARAAVEASRRNVEFDTGTEFDLLTAQNNYSVSISALSQARYDYLRNGLELKRAAGQLTKQDIVAIDNLLVQP